MANFVGTTGDDTQTGTGGDDTFDYSQGGEDGLRGRGGDDAFYMGAVLDADDDVDGGSGSDTLTLDGDYNIVLSNSTATNFETWILLTGHDYQFVVADGTVAASERLTVLKSDSDVSHFVVFDGSAETDGSFRIVTSFGADTVTGGAGDDDISSAEGADLLYGGLGDDELSAGFDGDTDVLYGGDGDDILSIANADCAYGGDGNDSVSTSTGGGLTGSTLDGGSGDDTITLAGGDVLSLQGGVGTDTLILDGGTTVDFASFEAGSTGFEVVQLGHATLRGLQIANVIDLSAFSGPSANQTLKLYGGGGADTLIGNIERDILHGGGGANTLSGMDGNDKLIGGNKDDTLTGGAGHDHLTGKGGDNIYAYGAASDSTSGTRDVIVGFGANHDSFVMPSAVNAVDAAIASGTLSRATFDADLAAAADDAHLAAHDAVVFTPDAGGFAGATFLVVDLNGMAGYQTGEDIVVQLKNASHLDELDAGNFS